MNNSFQNYENQPPLDPAALQELHGIGSFTISDRGRSPSHQGRPASMMMPPNVNTRGRGNGSPRMYRDPRLDFSAPRFDEDIRSKSTYPEHSSIVISTISSFSKPGDLNFDLSRLNNTTSFRPSNPKDFSGVENKDTIMKDNTSSSEAREAALLEYGRKICRVNDDHLLSSIRPQSVYFPGWTPDASFDCAAKVTREDDQAKGEGEDEVQQMPRAEPFVGARDWAMDKLEKFSTILPLTADKPTRRNINSIRRDTTAINRVSQLERDELRLTHRFRVGAERHERYERKRDENFRWEQGLEEEAGAESNLYVGYSESSEDDEFGEDYYDFRRNSRARDRRSRTTAYARSTSPATATSTQDQQAQNMNTAVMQTITNNGDPRHAQQPMQARFIQHQQKAMRARMQADQQSRMQTKIGFPGDAWLRPDIDVLPFEFTGHLN